MPPEPEMPYDVEDRGYDTPCWIYTGTINPILGYGQLTRGVNRNRYAHRFAYEREYGPPLAGMVVHHRCEQKACIRAEHLEAVTRGQHAVIHMRKFSPELLEEVRRATGSTRQIARRYGVSKSHVAFVRSSKPEAQPD